MPSFTPIRDIPQQGLSEWEAAVLSALKENVEILAGYRQAGVRAVTSDTITTQQIQASSYQQMLANGSGYTVSGVNVASVDDHNKLIQSVVNLAYDVTQLRNTLNALIAQLKQ